MSTEEPTALAFARQMLRDGTPAISATIVQGLIDIIDYDRRLIAGMDDKAARDRVDADKAATITTVDELDALPVGTVVYAASHIGPAERFKVGWMGCGSPAAWSSAVLARDGLPARVIHRGGTE